MNLASRLCSSAGNGQILVDAAAAAMVHGRVPLTALGTRALKGYDQPVAVHTVEFDQGHVRQRGDDVG